MLNFIFCFTKIYSEYWSYEVASKCVHDYYYDSHLTL